MKPPCTLCSRRFKLGGWWYNCDLFVLSLWMLQKDYFLFCTSFFWPWYYYAEASNSWVAWKFIFPQKNHLACLPMAESASWHTYKRESLFYQQQLCLSFNLEQQTGNQGTVQEAIPGKLPSEISLERTVMESNYIISLSFSVAIFSPSFFKREY